MTAAAPTSFSRRPATDADTATARAVHHRAYRDVVTRQFGSWDDERQDGFFATDWGAAAYDVLEVDGRFAGYVAVLDLPDRVHVRELVIDPDFQNRGIGTALLAAAKDLAAQRDVVCEIGGLHENRALDLYRRMGFVEYGRTETHTLLEWHPA